MDAITQASDLRNQRAAVTQKILETHLALAKIRRDWVVDGRETPLAVRVELSYNAAELELQRHAIDRELSKLRREVSAATFQARLVATLEQMGLGHVVEDARKPLAPESPDPAYRPDQI